MIDTCTRFSAFFGTAHGGRTAYALGYTGLGVAATRFGADVVLDLLHGEDTERTRLAMVREKPLPFPPEPFRSVGHQPDPVVARARRRQRRPPQPLAQGPRQGGARLRLLGPPAVTERLTYAAERRDHGRTHLGSRSPGGMHLATDLVLLAATVTTGLVAGLLYVFAHAVMPGLGSADDRLLVAAFQRIDAAIGNPWMMVTFLGSPVLTAAALVVDLAGDRAAVPWLVAALALVVATVLVTGACTCRSTGRCTRSTPPTRPRRPPGGAPSRLAGCAGTSCAP